MGSPRIGEGAADGIFKIDLYGWLVVYLAIVWLTPSVRANGISLRERINE